MPKRGTLSMDKAKSLINFYPKWHLERGYANYIKWYLSFFKNKKEKINLKKIKKFLS